MTTGEQHLGASVSPDTVLLGPELVKSDSENPLSVLGVAYTTAHQGCFIDGLWKTMVLCLYKNLNAWSAISLPSYRL